MITHKIGTVGVKLTSVVVLRKVELGLVDESDHLDVVGSVQELDTSEGVLRNDTGAILLVCAPRNLDGFGVSNRLVRLRRRPQAEV